MRIPYLVGFLVGLLFLILGGEALVRGASRLAALAGISPLVAGLTIIAFSTSAPELAVTVSSAFAGEPDIAVGNIVGSNIANILLVLGVLGLIAPLVVTRKLLRIDVPLMIAASLVMCWVARDQVVGRTEGLVLLALLVGYTVFSVVYGAREPELESGSEVLPQHGGWLSQMALVGVGVALLVLGGRLLVDSAVFVAHRFGVSELVVGLTIVALGTSLPELAVAVIATLRGEREMAVGNLIGSNLFNILCVLGLTAVIAPVTVAPSALHFDLPVMVAVAVACLPVFFYNSRFERWEGAMFLGYYLLYLTYLVLRASEHEALELFGRVTLSFVVPLSVVTLGVVAFRSWNRPAAHGQEASSEPTTPLS